jgi:hypothetical protein
MTGRVGRSLAESAGVSAIIVSETDVFIGNTIACTRIDAHGHDRYITFALAIPVFTVANSTRAISIVITGRAERVACGRNADIEAIGTHSSTATMFTVSAR